MTDRPNVVMGLRDASWYNRPNVRSVKVYHVVAGAHAACSSFILIDEHSTVPLEMAHFGLRCRRRACLNRWTAAS